MSGGQLVVLDRSGRDVKQFPLESGFVTLGSDHSCDIRFMLDTVNPHHATVTVHTNQTVLRSVTAGDTLVNGVGVSVAALRHGDVIEIGGRTLRWDYTRPMNKQQHTEQTHNLLCASRRAARGRARARASCPSSARRDRDVELALEMSHRASMPANAGGKQVAIVQPQRRDTLENNNSPAPRTPVQANKRPRTSKTNDLDVSVSDADTEKVKRKSSLQNTTKATLWIESRKTSPRRSVKVTPPVQTVTSARRNISSAKKSTPLRLTVLKRAQSAHKMRVTKIEAPAKIDHTKQAALLLMTGRTPKARLLTQKTSTPPKTVTPKVTTNTLRPKSAAGKSVSPRTSVRSSGSLVVKKKSPINRKIPGGRRSRPSASSTSLQNQTVSRNSLRKSSPRSSLKGLNKSPLLANPKKSALKNPSKRSMRKTESIKFDLSNLDNYSQESDVLLLTDTTHQTAGSTPGDEHSLRYSTSDVQSPSPRRSIHSRSSKILERTLGTTVSISPSATLTPETPRQRKSSRGSMIVQKALNKSDETYSRRTTKSLTDSHSTVPSAFRTHTLSPRSPRGDLESYSIVDLVSVDSNESGRSPSVYNSMGSTSTATFVTPQNSIGRKTRSAIDPGLVGSSTPYVKIMRMSSKRSLEPSEESNQQWPRGSKSVSTPQNTAKHISVNSTRISRASRSRSRINDSDLMLIEPEDADDSPKSSRRVSAVSKRSSSAPEPRHNSFINTITSDSPVKENGMSTPENRQSPEEATTPVLNIQSFLNSSQHSLPFRKRGRPSLKRKTIGVLTGQDKTRVSTKSKSLNFNPTMTRSVLSNDSYEDLNISNQDGDVVTPKSEVKLVQEAVKNKHSTAKKPQSKRSIIDDLNKSDIVKQLFNSPVKRKLSQSITEFSRKQLFDDDVMHIRRPTRNTVALTGRSPDRSLVNRSETFTPERFVSPINTPSNSPNLDGIKRLFEKNMPENDLRNVRGVKALLRSPRARKSIKNDLTNVSGMKNVFARSPRNSLSDVRVKDIFNVSPDNDLRRVSGVRSLFHSQETRRSPRNSLSDVRGVKHLYRRNKNELDDLSGVEELFNESNQSHRDSESLFDQLIGKPPIKAVYSKTFSSKSARKDNARKHKSLHASLDVITNNVEDWLQQELNKCLHKNGSASAKSRLSRELQKLATNTVEGTTPLRTTRVRNSTVGGTSAFEPEPQKSVSQVYSARKLPIKKRSWVDASLEQTKNGNKSIYIPIKKRAVLHSTPVKGKQGNMTMNASELGRVSPIVADKTQDLEHERTSNITALTRSRRGRKPAPKSPEVNNPSPKKATGKKNTQTKSNTASSPKVKPTHRVSLVSPHKDDANLNKNPTGKPVTPLSKVTRTTRSRKTTATSPQAGGNTKKRASLIITKKTPVLRPHPKASLKRQEMESLSTVEARSPRRTRATRKNDEVIEKLKTPKNRRAKIQKAKVVVSKPSPKIKMRAARTKAVQILSETSKTRQAAVKVKKISPKKTPVNNKLTNVDVPKTRGRKTVIDNISNHSTDSEPNQPKTKRGRNTKAEATIVSRNTRNTNKQESIEEKAGRKPKYNSDKKSTVKEASRSKSKRTNKDENVIEEPEVKRNRANKQVVVLEEIKTSSRKTNKIKTPQAKTSGEKAQVSLEPEPATRSRRAAKHDNTVVVERNTRKRKAADSDDRPTKVSKKLDVESRGRRNKQIESPTETVSKKVVVKEAKPKKQVSLDAPKRGARSKKADVSVESPKGQQRSTRGRKTIMVPEASTVIGKRKRQNATLPAEEERNKARGGGAESPKRARTTRATAVVAVTGKVGRSRRR